jgi:hypothetical protein
MVASLFTSPSEYRGKLPEKESGHLFLFLSGILLLWRRLAFLRLPRSKWLQTMSISSVGFQPSGFSHRPCGSFPLVSTIESFYGSALSFECYCSITYHSYRNSLHDTYTEAIQLSIHLGDPHAVIKPMNDSSAIAIFKTTVPPAPWFPLSLQDS